MKALQLLSCVPERCPIRAIALDLIHHTGYSPPRDSTMHSTAACLARFLSAEFSLSNPHRIDTSRTRVLDLRWEHEMYLMFGTIGVLSQVGRNLAGESVSTLLGLLDPFVWRPSLEVSTIEVVLAVL